MRTPLHWTAWGNARIDILVAFVNGYPTLSFSSTRRVKDNELRSKRYFGAQFSGRVVTPFLEALAEYPAFCASLESQTCGNVVGLVTQVGLSTNNEERMWRKLMT
jgi:hypothetical protein